jgi:hypothetical protein
MGGEPNFHFYDNPLHPTWTTQTVAHNTMTVDETSQAASDGKLLVFEDTPQLKVMRAESAGSYAGVVLDRTVVVTPDLVIDVFTGRSTLPHTWDRTLRFNGALAGLPVAPDAKPLGTQNGYQHFKVAATNDAAAGWAGVWNTKADNFAVTLAGTPGQQVMIGSGPNKDEMALARQSGTEARFATAYALEAWKNPVQSVRWLTRGEAANNGASAVEVTQQDGTVTRVMVAQNLGAWQVGAWKSDARVLATREKGAESRLLLTGGTFASDGKAELRQAAAGNYSAQKRGAQFEISSRWTP